MSEATSDNWETLRQAREKLAAQLGIHPEISLIDIGFDPQSQDPQDPVVLRVHVRQAWSDKKVPIPQQLDGIRIVIVAGDYRLE